MKVFTFFFNIEKHSDHLYAYPIKPQPPVNPTPIYSANGEDSAPKNENNAPVLDAQTAENVTWDYELLSGAEFVLEKDGVTYYPGEQGGCYFYFTGIDAGTYTLIETKARTTTTR